MDRINPSQSQAAATFIQAARTTGQAEAPRIPPPPVRIGRFERAPVHPPLPVPVIRLPAPPPAAPRPLPAVRIETGAPRLEQIVQARAQAAGVPARAGRVEDRAFAERLIQDDIARQDAVVQALQQRALAVTLGQGGRLQAPGGPAPSILDTAR